MRTAILMLRIKWMRLWVTLLLLFGFAWPAMAIKPATVDQVELLLIRLKGKPDVKVAHELEDLQLTERASSARLARWQKEFSGSRTGQELTRLVDQSTFLDPPASDVIPDPPPDPDTQRHMLWMAEQYLSSTMSHLPNFSATREMAHFEAAPSGNSSFAAASAKPLQWTGATSQTVTYRDGHELVSQAADDQENEPSFGFTTHGEFGPLLSQVLGDAHDGETRFLRWEQGPSEPAAVFHFTVPEEASHFKINEPAGSEEQAAHPAYHGEIEIDPESGAVLRLSEIANLQPPMDAERAAVEVEYTPVEIGDRSFICPVKAVALFRIPVPLRGAKNGNGAESDPSSWPIQTSLNDVIYSHYHE